MVRLAWIASALLIIVAAWAGLRYAERGLSSPVADPANAERGTAQEDIAGSPARGATDQRPSTAAGSLPSAAMQPPETMLAQVQDAEPDFAAPAEQDEKQGGAEQTPRSMIGSLREALSPFRDLFTGDQQESIPDLQKAEQTWLDIKRDARQAIRQANRQVRVSPQRSPNIVLITADALAWNDLGAYGQQRVKTPMIDAMALEGLRFTDYYAGSPHRPTAACTLATGLHSGHCPVREDGALAVLPADSKTLAKVMWYAGYATYMIGYWPLGEPDTTGAPQRQGYDLALWQPARGDGAPSLPAVIYQNEQSRELSALNDDLPGTTPLEWITDRAEAMLSKPPHRPFFLRLAYQLPKAEPLPVADEADADAAQRLHAATIEQFDRHVGRVLQAVRDAKLGRNTFVILTAERAPQQFGPVEDSFDRAGLLRTGGVLPEGKLRVPMIVWNAHGEPPTGLQTTPWAAWDLLPTLADLTSALHRPALLDGRSYAHLLSRLVLSGKTAAKSFYWETLLDPPGQAVRRGVWKATRAAGSDALQLFNLDRDPGETENLADTEQAMAELLEEIMRRNAQPLVEKRQAQPQ